MRKKITLFKALFCVALIGMSSMVMATDIPVTPGDGTLEAAVAAASPGDVLILQNGGVYNVYTEITIGIELSIVSQSEPGLPGLSGLPLILNIGSLTTLFKLTDGVIFTISGIEVDMGGGKNMIDTSGDGTFKWYADKCRFHNMKGNVLDDNYGNEVQVLEELKVTNSFLYDLGEKAVYNLGFSGKTNQLHQNNTYWNITKQLDYIEWRQNDEDPIAFADEATIIYDHCTIAKIATSGSKEFLGMDNSDDRPPLQIEIKNSILAYQGTLDTDFSIKGGVSPGGIFNISNNCVWEVWPVQEAFNGVVTNWFEMDPIFSDTATMDFTVNSTNPLILQGASDGEILGAIYWDPDYGIPDDTTISVFNDMRSEFSLRCFPNPSSDLTMVSFNLSVSSDVNVSVINMVGQEVRNLHSGRMFAGIHDISLNVSTLSKGFYLLKIESNNKFETQKLLVK